MTSSQENIDTHFPLDGNSATSSLGEPNCNLPDRGFFFINILNDPEIFMVCNFRDSYVLGQSLYDDLIPIPSMTNAIYQRDRHRRKTINPTYKKQCRCRNLFYRAIEKGEIKKPDTCEICGNKKKLDGHHDDYSKPYEVKWLCRKCHKRVHSGRTFNLEVK